MTCPQPGVGPGVRQLVSARWSVQPEPEGSGCRSDPTAALSSSKPWARGMASHLHATGSSPSQRHFLLEAILPRSCLNHPPPTLQPSWHHQDSQASGHRYLHLREGPGMA